MMRFFFASSATMLLLMSGCVSDRTGQAPAPLGGGASAHLASADLSKLARLTVLQHEYMADVMTGRYVGDATGRTMSYVSDGPELYLFPEMKHRLTPTQRSNIFGEHELDNEAMATLRPVPLRPPVRYRRVGFDELEAGYLDPAHRLFFRWRGVKVRAAEIRTSASDDVISPILEPLREIDEVIDIDAPPTSARSPAGDRAASVEVPLLIPQDKDLRIVGMEYLASTMRPLWIERGSGYSVAFADRKDSRLIYHFPQMEWPREFGPPPGTNPPQAEPRLAESELKHLKVIDLHAAPRYRRLEGAKVEAGYYDPRHQIFFRWRDVVRTQDYDVFFDPGCDPISQELPPSRIAKIVDVNPPEEATK